MTSPGKYPLIFNKSHFVTDIIIMMKTKWLIKNNSTFRYFLTAMPGSVFETLFYGDMADKNKMIRIPDVAPIGFENLLRYAYTDSLNLNSVEDAMLTAYAAKKYLLPQLLRECLNYIEKNIAPSSACAVYEFAQVLNSHQLILQAINLIDRQTYSVVTHKSFK